MPDAEQHRARGLPLVSEPFILHSIPMMPRDMLSALEQVNNALDNYLATGIYVNQSPDFLESQKKRYISTLKAHAERVGDRPTYLLRAPGRLNAFLEYLDMCAGDHMSTTIDGDIVVAVSPREDDIVSCANSNPLFPSGEFSISGESDLFHSAPWDGDLADTWDNRTRVHPFHGRTRGDWMNYVRCPFLRAAWELPGTSLRGVDMTFGPSSAPFRAGTSSSSAVVVLGFLSLYLANRDRLPGWSIQDICRLLGEAEWYVGTHGGANDQTTILRSQPNGVLYNRHSRPVLDSTPLPCLRGVKVVLANSLWEANKALGANYTFNLRKGWMDLGDDVLTLIIRSAADYLADGGVTHQGWLTNLLRKRFGFSPDRSPERLESDASLWETISARYHRFGSLVEDLLGVPDAAIEELISLLPETISPEDASRLLGKEMSVVERDYTLPKPPDEGYRIRSAAIFFHMENRIGRALERIFLEADGMLVSGRMSEDSPEYDAYRIEVGRLLDRLQDTLRDDFQVSNSQLDLLLDIARRGPGYLGGKLTGAGSGGCVSILVREGQEEDFCRYLDREYYGKPEHFDHYRAVLGELERSSSEGSAEHRTVREMRANLENALNDIPDQRRAITFSRGACIIELDRFSQASE